ncbi:MAG: DNA double-strand break repair nuclease NurA [Candidatus Diapherotrites archaeon]|nr:DNA double-strand break repair nuclease NurA [Candidatus Diapherotrites archaeon]
MPSWDSVVSSAVEAIHSLESRKQEVARALAPHKARFCLKVVSLKGNFQVGGADSGFVDKRLSLVDLVFIRTVGVVFDFVDGNLSGSHYLPGFFQPPFPRMLRRGLEEDEVGCSKSLLRLKEELRMAQEVIAEFRPGYFFIDGSLVPQYQDQPRTESILNEDYHSVLEEFQSLYALAEKNNCLLMGAIEDSRGTRFRSILQERVIPSLGLSSPVELDGLQDSSLLDYLLEVGERTHAFPYTQNVSNHAILKDFDSHWSRQLHGLYVKPAPFDHPVRVEFLSDLQEVNAVADRVAGITFALSSLHREYAFPSVLIEADLRAGLHPTEVDMVFSKISDKLSKNVKLRLRRGNRPFK